MTARARTWWCGALVVAVSVAACDRTPAHAPPRASFLVEAGDSTFWAMSSRGRTHVRRSPLLLAQLDGRFHEIYVADDDRSYYDAIMIGQRIYRRDLMRGDSVKVFEDTTIARIAEAYAASHPDERPLKPDEDASDDPASVATTDTEILHVLGPFVILEQHMDIALASGSERHTTRQFVVDLRAGRVMTLADLAPGAMRDSVVRAGLAAFAAVRDSVERSSDRTAQPAAGLMEDFSFDSTSFALVVSDAQKPAVAFAAPGTGHDAGSTVLPLPPIEIPSGAWWSEIAPTLPTTTGADADVWKAEAYDVVVQYDSVAGSGLLLLRDQANEEWPIGPVPLPVWRIQRVDVPPHTAASRRALSRAFDDAARYSDAPRSTAASSHSVPGLPAVDRLIQPVNQHVP
jgi:hypothetical protein